MGELCSQVWVLLQGLLRLTASGKKIWTSVVCLCLCVSTWQVKKKTTLMCVICKPHYLDFLTSALIFSLSHVSFCRHTAMLSHHRTAGGKSLTNPRGVSGDGGITGLITSLCLRQDQVEEAPSGWGQANGSGYQIMACHCINPGLV